MLRILVLFALSCNVAVALSELDKLCDGSLAKIDRISQAKALVEESRSTGSCEQLKSPLSKLESILAQVESGHTCNLDFVEEVRNYHDEFIGKASLVIPRALRRFFISMCFELSAKCKTNLLDRLASDTSGKITDEDFAIIEAPIGGKSAEVATNLNEIVLAQDLKALAGKLSGAMHVIVGSEASKRMREMIRVCIEKFEPFYSKLIVPLVELSKMGYDNSSEDSQDFVRRWYGVVKTCESFAAVEIFEDKANIISGNKKKNSLALVSAEKAMHLRASQGSLAENLHPTIDYTIDDLVSTIDDKLPVVDEQKLEELVAKAAKTSQRGIKSLLKKSLKAKLKWALSSGKLHLSSLSSLKCSIKPTKKCKGEVVDFNADKLVSQVDRDEAGVDNRAQERGLEREAEPKEAWLDRHQGLATFLCFVSIICIVVMGIILTDWGR